MGTISVSLVYQLNMSLSAAAPLEGIPTPRTQFTLWHSADGVNPGVIGALRAGLCCFSFQLLLM